MEEEKNLYNEFFDKKKKNDDNGKKKIMIIITIIFALLALGITCYFIVKNEKNRDNNDNSSGTKTDVKQNHNIKFEDDLKYDENSNDSFIYIYKDKNEDSYYATMTYGHIDDNGVSINECELVKKYKCQDKECKVNSVNPNFVITDGNMHFSYNAREDRIIDTTGEINIYSDDDFKIGIVDSKYFYVNGKKIDFYSEVKKIRNNYPSEEEFYNHNGTRNALSIEFDGVKTKLLMSVTYDYKKIDDVIYVRVVSSYNNEDHFEFFVDKNGTIVKMIGSGESDINLSGEYDLLDKIEGNTMYFNVNMDYLIEYSKEIPYCDKKAKNALDDVAIVVDKVTYLGNNEFTVEKGVSKTTYKEIGEKSTIDCSNLVIK